MCYYTSVVQTEVKTCLVSFLVCQIEIYAFYRYLRLDSILGIRTLLILFCVTLKVKTFVHFPAVTLGPANG